jgi:hypothetical protein
VRDSDSVSQRPEISIAFLVDASGRPIRGGEIDGGLELVSPFVARVDDPELPFLVEFQVFAWKGRLAARDVRVWMRRGEPVTSAELRRVKVGQYLAQIREEHRQLTGRPLFGRRLPTDDPEVVAFEYEPRAESDAVAPMKRKRRRPSEALPVVAEAYRNALVSPDPRIAASPTQYVAAQLRCTRGHASRLVSAARRAGYLGKALPGRPGEETGAGGSTS